MDAISSTFNRGFGGQTYSQWFLFLILFVFMWGIAVSANTLLRRAV